MMRWFAGLMGGRQDKGVAAAPPQKSSVRPDAASQGAALRQQGNELLAQDRLDEARACYEKALELDGQDVPALVNLGFVHLSLGRHADAIACLERAVALAPGDFDACYLLAGAREQSADLPGAADGFRRSLEIRPAFEPARLDLCRVLAQVGQAKQARELIEQGMQLNPGFADFHYYQGNLWLQDQQADRAIASFLKALSLGSSNPHLHANLGSAYEKQNSLDLAASSYLHAVTLDPQNASFHRLRATSLLRLGKVDDAIASYRNALKLDESHAATYSDLGDALRLQGDLAAAVESCTKAILLQPDLAAAHNNLGAALAQDHLPLKALECFDKAIALAPQFAQAFSNRGNTLLGLRRLQEALADLELAASLTPDDARVLNQLGVAQQAMGLRDRALKSYEAAHAAAPDYAEALNNRGNVLMDLGRLAEADASYALALSVDKDYAEAYFNRGNVLRRAGRLEEAMGNYERAKALKPGLPFLFGNWLHVKMHACDWSGLEAAFDELARQIEVDRRVFNPFTLVATSLSPAQQKLAAELYAADQFPAFAVIPELMAAPSRGRIRIGYFSADFHDHATAYLMAELFELHDKSRFELFAFSFGPVARSPMRTRLEAAFDHFLVINELTDQQAAARARQLGLDIAVDLKGFTQNSRPGIFAHRAAPVQVSYLGYPGTMGAPYIDYLVTDRTIVPQSHQRFYTECIASLPDSYQANDSRRVISERQFTREESGLPQSGFVFCCFNNNFKITPVIFSLWMRLLDQVDGSVLWLLEDNALAVKNLRMEARARGIDPDRLVFAPRMALPDHLARHRLADLFLDTIHCNAHTTASDALWAGLPVLTCIGETFAGRVAASLLNAVGMQELVAQSLDEYEATALQLAMHPAQLASVKARLEANRTTTPLFNAQALAAHLESLFAQMHARRAGGLPPVHIPAAA